MPEFKDGKLTPRSTLMLLDRAYAYAGLHDTDPRLGDDVAMEYLEAYKQC